MSTQHTGGRSVWSRLSDHLEENSEGFGPLRGTLGVGRIGMIWLAANLVVTTLLTGTLFVPGVSWPVALGMIVLGTLVGAAVLVLVGNMGTRTGLATMALMRGSFGLRGSFLPVAANVVILMGWSWVQAMLAGITVNFLVAQVTGFSSPVLFSVLCQLLVVALAIFGHEGIARVEPWLAFVILAIMGYVYVVAFTTHPVSDFAAVTVDPAAGSSAIGVLDIVIATAISWTVLSAEFNRLARSQTAGVVGSGVGYVISTVAAMSLGATAITHLILGGGEPVGFDPTVLVVAFGAPLAVVIFLSVMATNTMVVYGMVSSVVDVAPSHKIRFLPASLVLGGISVLGATWLSLLDQFTSFLVPVHPGVRDHAHGLLRGEAAQLPRGHPAPARWGVLVPRWREHRGRGRVGARRGLLAGLHVLVPHPGGYHRPHLRALRGAVPGPGLRHRAVRVGLPAAASPGRGPRGGSGGATAQRG